MSIAQTSVGSLPASVTPPAPLSFYLPHSVKLEQLEDHWRILGDRMASPMQRYAWAKACADTFATPKNIRLHGVARNGDVVAIAPMIYRRMDSVRHLAILGSRELHEPIDLVYRDVDALEHLLDTLIATGSPLFLERVPADSPTVAAVNRLHPRRAIVIQRPQAVCPYIPLDPSWIEPESHLNSGRRSDLRRAMRKAQHRGSVDFQILRPKITELDELLDSAFKIEAASWKGRTRTALLCDRLRGEFFRQFTRSVCADGSLRLCFLNIAHRPAAMQLAVECFGAFWLLKIGYDEQFADCSPGQLLLRESIKHAAESGLTSYEFLGSAAPWTQVWTRHERQCVSLWAYPNSLRGMTALSVRAARAVLHRWRRQCRTAVPRDPGVSREK